MRDCYCNVCDKHMSSQQSLNRHCDTAIHLKNFFNETGSNRIRQRAKEVGNESYQPREYLYFIYDLCEKFHVDTDTVLKSVRGLYVQRFDRIVRQHLDH